MTILIQYSRPAEDIVVGGWETAPLFDKIDETPVNDLDLVSVDDPDFDSFKVRLSGIDFPLLSTVLNQKLTVRMKKEGPDSAEVTFRLLKELYTEIATKTVTVSSAFTDYELELTPEETDLITDYADLYLEVTADVSPSSSSSTSSSPSSSSTSSTSSSSSSGSPASSCKFPSTVSNLPYQIDPWTNVNNVKVDDSSYATNELDDAVSDWIQCTNFGFTIPEGATIVGIVVKALVKDSLGANVLTDAQVQLRKSSGYVGDTKYDADGSPNWVWTNSDHEIDFGASNSLWGTSWSAADINDADFGCKFLVYNPEHEDAIANVDYIQICVHYLV
ncbi:MAG: hypothetical protein AB7O38_28320 [Pirellulaceae bacterium]